MTGTSAVSQIGEVIAVLGIYVALMSVLSVSVEVIISWFKIPIPWLQGMGILNQLMMTSTLTERTDIKAT